ncbi:MULTISPECIES: hypothetical protein [Pseudomonas]|uniref:Uncharacterized protein n=1 Tax=Pseudomonas palleroniana TaxID=191390 RepID=A0A1H5B3X5_9PSED|nr:MULTISPECIES: hypothetical protein [Pseudomonas]KAB0567608.1 hypothetical protein F7R03_11495 [Pseudomonas palleroniana]MBM9488118.1 hypothetical protein [Pseudomonas sp. ICBG1301]SED49076.1 hypothetical protein SAMN04490198_0323 [Pseudomonas palleroniana]
MIDIIATLGPVGTDSHIQAARVGSTVSLHSTFHAAIEHAKKFRTGLLVPAGFREDRDGKQFSWVDFHFEYLDSFELQSVWFEKTLPMGLLHKSYDSIALHPSTCSLITDLDAYKEIKYTRSKVDAYQRYSQGEVASVLASTSMFNQIFDQPYIKSRFNPTMVWCLYRTLTCLT